MSLKNWTSCENQIEYFILNFLFSFVFLVRKVVGQLKSRAEETRKPETWAKAVQGIHQNQQDQEVVGEQPLPHPPPPRPLLTNEDDDDEEPQHCDKENVEPFVVVAEEEENRLE